YFHALIRPRPSRPLFPYAPLFRSPLVDGDGDVVGVGGPDPLAPRPDLGPDLVELVGGEERLPALAPRLDEHLGDGRGVAGRSRPDRKSTRLNSSHVKISYAVFCLK